MHSVRHRQVQECIGSCQLQQLPSKLEFTSEEHSFEQLHLQRGLVEACRRRVHSMRQREI